MANMDFSPTGWLARYSRVLGLLRNWLPVEGWTADGDPLVVDIRHRGQKLVPAKGIDGYQQLEQCHKVVSTVPAHYGWTVARDVDYVTVVSPVVAWIVTASGAVLPAVAMDGGQVEPVYGAIRGPGQQAIEESAA